MYWALYTFWPSVNGAPEWKRFKTLTGQHHVWRKGIWHLFGPALVVFPNGTSLKHVPDTIVHGLKDNMPFETAQPRRNPPV
jgi:hypothetical protein